MPLLAWNVEDLQAHLLIPGLSHDSLRTLLQGGPDAAAAPDGLAWKAITGLAVWTVAPLVAALAWFSRQDLSKE
jgi:ABC-2 type transport system permease protein